METLGKWAVVCGAALVAAGCSPAFNHPASTAGAGRFVLGQPDFVSDLNLARGLDYPGATATDGTKLYVGDNGNRRVVIWNRIPTANRSYPDAVLGQPTLFENMTNNGGVGAASMSFPHDVSVVGTRLLVTDTYNSRVLVWNTLPSSNLQQPDLVLGQTNFTSGAVNAGGLGPSSLNFPTSAHTDGTRLVVADTFNARVLIWTTFPTVNGQPADRVLGQDGFTTNAVHQGVLGEQKLNQPYAVRTDGTSLVVADAGDNRVLVWHAFPTANHQKATLVLGQISMTVFSANSGGAAPTGSTLSSPEGLCLDAGKLFVADTSNNRVLGWNTLPPNGSANGTSADFALGQASLTDAIPNAGGLGAKSLQIPQTVDCGGGSLRIADSGNHRILFFHPIPVAGFTAAEFALGQPDFASAGINNPGVSFARINRPRFLDSDGTRLFAADAINHRILGWKALPTTTAEPADLVLGQPNDASATPNTGGLSAQTLSGPTSVRIDGDRLIVADTDNHRVLIWKTLPKSQQQPADLVLGQPSFSSSAANNGGIGPGTFNSPVDTASDGTRLAVTDTGNHRVLIWNQYPTSSSTPADIVLGQPDMVSKGANTGGISAASLSNPQGIRFSSGRFLIADAGNNRVLVFSSVPAVSGAAADFVLGQPDLAGNAANQGGAGARSLSAPYDVAVAGNRLFVVDFGNHRVLIWNTFPSTSFTAADEVFGQSNFTTSKPNNGGISADSLNSPLAILARDDGYTVIADYGNDRLLGDPGKAFAWSGRPAIWAAMTGLWRRLIGGKP